MKGRIVVFYGSQIFPHRYFCIQFLLDLPFQCFLRCFALLYFAARKFPATFEFPIASLCCIYFPIMDDYRSNNFYCFQNTPLPIFPAINAIANSSVYLNQL